MDCISELSGFTVKIINVRKNNLKFKNITINNVVIPNKNVIY